MNLADKTLRAVVWGTQAAIVKQMTEQLNKRKIVAQGVTDEKKLIAVLREHDPDLIFLEINGPAKSPVPEIVKVVFMWVNNFARKINRELNSPSARLWQKAKVVMFKSELEDDGTNPAGTTITDLDDLLLQCQEHGPLTYIGLYASWSLSAKIKPLLIEEPK